MIYLFYSFAVCCVYQFIYQLILIATILKTKKNKKDFSPSVSIIICAKNEFENLTKNLPFILSQNYTDFEVIIVDDGSDKSFMMNDERLTILNLSKEEKIGLGKKYALQKGIEAAKNKVILLTDADCIPVSENWIFEMTTLLQGDYKIVLGLSQYKQEATWLNGMIEYETAQTAMQYSGYALIGIPYMGVGRNICYDAGLLKTKKWSAQELSIASGDDDLAIQSLANSKNTTVCFSKDGATTSSAPANWASWLKQKLRHYESGKLYKPIHKLLLGSFLISKYFLYLSFILLLFSNYDSTVILFFIIYLVFTTVINALLNKKTGLMNRWYLTVVYDILYIAFTVTLGIISQFKTTKNWK